MNIDYTAIGDRVKAKRVAKGISQEQLAEKADLSVPHTSHVETGNTKASLKTIINIANALEVSVDELLCDNVIRSKHVFEKELSDLIEDCTDIEIRAVAEVAKSTKNALRNFAASLDK